MIAERPNRDLLDKVGFCVISSRWGVRDLFFLRMIDLPTPETKLLPLPRAIAW